MKLIKKLFCLFMLWIILVATYMICTEKVGLLDFQKFPKLATQDVVYKRSRGKVSPRFHNVLTKHEGLRNYWSEMTSITFREFASKNFLHQYTKGQSLAGELCENLLSNITDGKWIRKLDLLIDTEGEDFKILKGEEERFDRHLTEYRIARGMHTRLWRDDQKCGWSNVQKLSKGSKWPPSLVVGGWCDARGPHPCCSDEENGACGMLCNCPRCVDMRQIYHAELSEWVLTDSKCKWRNYTAERACDVVSRFSELYFIGDSLNRLLTQGFLTLLRSNPNSATRSKYSDENLCYGTDQFYYKECFSVLGSFEELLVDRRPLCGMNLKRFSMYNYPSIHEAEKFHEVVKSLAGKRGSVILLSVGLWMHCESELTSKTYLAPAVEYLDDFYKIHGLNRSRRWPLIVFVTPDTAGILKPKAKIDQTGNRHCSQYTKEMKKYCSENSIPVLDTRKLTRGIHTFDGTHYGLGANVMKVQLLLNYLDLVSTGKNWSVAFPISV